MTTGSQTLLNIPPCPLPVPYLPLPSLLSLPSSLLLSSFPLLVTSNLSSNHEPLHVSLSTVHYPHPQLHLKVGVPSTCQTSLCTAGIYKFDVMVERKLHRLHQTPLNSSTTSTPQPLPRLPPPPPPTSTSSSSSSSSSSFSSSSSSPCAQENRYHCAMFIVESLQSPSSIGLDVFEASILRGFLQCNQVKAHVGVKHYPLTRKERLVSTKTRHIAVVW